MEMDLASYSSVTVDKTRVQGMVCYDVIVHTHQGLRMMNRRLHTADMDLALHVAHLLMQHHPTLTSFGLSIEGRAVAHF